MRVGDTSYRSIWLAHDERSAEIIDQTLLPHRFETKILSSVDEVAEAISAMRVRGAPLIGATAAYGMALAMQEDASDAHLEQAASQLLKTRPTAVNLRWALEEMKELLAPLPPEERLSAAYVRAELIADEDVALNKALGGHGQRLIEIAADRKDPGQPVNILTHCNAGWLATVDWGTALSPIFQAHDAGVAVHVWVDETRPRNQGLLTAWELKQHGVPHTYIADNAGGLLMQRGQVDLCIVGTDRVTARGDVCNKIGTYLKALAAEAHGVPFYVALPGPTIDWRTEKGSEVPIEERDGAELRVISGLDASGQPAQVTIAGEDTPVSNLAFDVTPAELVSAFITERGVAPATAEGLRALYPDDGA